MRTVLLALTLLAAAPAVAFPYGSDSFVDAKSGYRVDVSHVGETMVLDGYNAKTHEHLNIKVVGDHVTGVMAGKRVDYILPAALENEQLASR